MSQPMATFCAASGVPQSPNWLETVSQSAQSGDGTPIVASAKVVGTAIAEKKGYRIGWGRYCKYALPAMILVVGLCNLLLIIKYT